MISRSDISDAVESLKEKISDKVASIHFGKRDVDAWSSDLEVVDPTKTAPKADPTFGIEPTFKIFYEGKNSNPHYYDWTGTYDAPRTKSILTIHNQKSHQDKYRKRWPKPMMASLSRCIRSRTWKSPLCLAVSP